MMIDGHGRSWHAGTREEVAAALAFRDSRGGADLWASETPGTFPCLGIRISGSDGSIHYFPTEKHPGYRCIRQPPPQAPNGTTTFVFEGCDPGDGEMVPNEFVLPFAVLVDVVNHFVRTRSMAPSNEWFEL
jgi:hypothetical protein